MPPDLGSSDAAPPTPTPAMPTPAMQGEAASKDDHGVARFVSPARDLAAKPGSQQDSWFIVANLQTERGPLDVLTHFLFVAPPGQDPAVQVMCSSLEARTGKYSSEEKAYPAAQCTLSPEKLDVRTPNGNFTGTPKDLRLKGNFANIQFELAFSHQGPMLTNLGNGVLPFLGDINFHYAFPSMTAKGRVTLNGEPMAVTGVAWLDRQWGVTPRFFTPDKKRWVWFAICLENGDRMSVWEVTEYALGIRHAFATVLHPDGGHEVVPVEALEEKASKPWTSPATGCTYPTSWELHIPALDARLHIEPEVIEQEIVSPVGAHKYEGSSPVSGTMRGREVSGTAFIELVGHWK